MPELVIGDTHILELQARKRADTDPVGASVDLAIRFLMVGHADHGKYWDHGGTWEAAAVVAATPTTFHCQQYSLPAAALDADKRGGWITVRVADTDAVQVGEEIQYPIVLYTLDTLAGLLGEYQITVHTQDADTNDLPSVSVSIYSEDNGTFLTSSITDSGGDANFALAGGIYQVRLSKDLYGFTVPTQITVTADATETITGTVFSAPTPADPDNCVVYGTLRDAFGNVMADEVVRFFAATPQGLAAVQLGKRPGQVITDSDGYFQIEIQKLAEVWVKNPGTGIWKKLIVPNSASQDISTWTTWVPT